MNEPRRRLYDAPANCQCKCGRVGKKIVYYWTHQVGSHIEVYCNNCIKDRVAFTGQGPRLLPRDKYDEDNYPILTVRGEYGLFPAYEGLPDYIESGIYNSHLI